MAAKITYSTKPVVFDTLPAIKVQYYTFPANNQSIYCYGRCYILNGNLALSLTSFERQPPPTSAIAFIIKGTPSLFIEVQPASCHFYTLNHKNEKIEIPTQIEPSYFAGQDEQGWYWGVNLLLSNQFLSISKNEFTVGSTFAAAIVKYGNGKSGFGASYPISNSAIPLDFDNFPLFDIVSY